MKLFRGLFFSLIFFVFTIVGVVSLINFLENRGFFNLSHSDVQITNVLSQPNYLSPLVLEADQIVKTFHDISLWKLDLNEIAKNIQGKKWVNHVNVSRRWPNGLLVYIEMKSVKLNLLGKKGQIFPITEDAEILPEMSLKNIPDLVVLRGEGFERSLDLRKKAIQLINQIPNSGSFSSGTISEILYENKEGFVLRMSKNGLKIKLGEDQFAIKAARLNKVLEYLDTKAIDAYLVDANLSKKVLVKVKRANDSSKIIFQ